MRKSLMAGALALAAGSGLLLSSPANAAATSMDADHCTVWYNGVFGGGSCHTYTVPASDGHWVRGGVIGGPGASYLIRDTDTWQVVCGEQTAWSTQASFTCFGLYGAHYRVEVVGAPTSAVAWVSNY